MTNEYKTPMPNRIQLNKHLKNRLQTKCKKSTPNTYQEIMINKSSRLPRQKFNPLITSFFTDFNPTRKNSIRKPPKKFHQIDTEFKIKPVNSTMDNGVKIMNLMI